MLGTASQVPTRHRNHNGYLLRWDAEGILFDPGEGTQRQFTLAGVSPGAVTRICITHFHGDHCLGLPGMLMRLALDGGRFPIDVHYPASGDEHLQHLRRASVGQDRIPVREWPTAGRTAVDCGPFTLRSVPLRHRVETLGWRIDEPDGRRMLPARLAERGVAGPDIGRLQREGTIAVDGRTVALEEVERAAARPVGRRRDGHRVVRRRARAGRRRRPARVRVDVPRLATPTSPSATCT